MQNNLQKTISKPISITGIGLHTGKKSELVLNPAEPNNGIIFKRIDQNPAKKIQAIVENVVSTKRGTVIEENGARVHTVEHVLSALFGMGVDNACIELSGSEPPILDGSSAPFVDLIKKAQIKNQNQEKNFFKVNNTVKHVNQKTGAEINILPYNGFKITFLMDYGLPGFGNQYTQLNSLEKEYENEFAPARTFGLLSEIAQLLQAGLIMGASLKNSVVFADIELSAKEKTLITANFGKETDLNFKTGKIINSEGLRFDNEPVRHKVLDLVGDLALFGRPIQGHVVATKSGHSANIEIVKELIRLQNEN